MVAGSNPVTPTYRTEDRTFARPQVDFPGFERAFGPLSPWHPVETEFDPVRYQAGDWCPVGSSQDAQIVLFNDQDYVIRVAQNVPHESRAEPGDALDPAA